MLDPLALIIQPSNPRNTHMTMKKIGHTFSLLTLLLGIGTAALADDNKVIQSLSNAEIVRLLQESGFPGTKIDEDDDVSVKMRGYNVWFMKGKNPQNIQARFGLKGTKTSLQKANQWNKTKRYSSAYIDDDGDVILKSDLDLEKGVTLGSVKEFIKTFYILQGAFLQEVIEDQ
jgi:hypothetical protein